MKKTLLHSRSIDYLLLLGLVAFLIAGGLVTMSCGRDSFPSGMVVEKPGVSSWSEAGFIFESGSNAQEAEYELGMFVELGDGGTAPCMWKAVRSLAPMKGRTLPTGSLTLNDFELADASEVKLVQGSSRATIFRATDRVVNFVCQYQLPGNVFRVATKSVRVYAF